MDVQFIKAPDGSEMVVMPRVEFLKLQAAVEDIQDALAHSDIERKLASGEEEHIPSEFANRLIDGENPVRVWREYRGLKAAELAAKAGISQAYLSEIETGKKEGRVSTLSAIAGALGLTIDDLV